MTELLEQMFKRASTPSPKLQNILANQFLQEIEWETQWNNTFNKSQGLLDKFVLKAMQEYEVGLTEEISFYEL